MSDKLYKLMDRRNIEGVLYADIDNPKVVLGAKEVKEGYLIQALVPDAVEAFVKFDGEKTLHQMEEMEEGGYYAVLLSKKGKGPYKIVANYGDGSSLVCLFKKAGKPVMRQIMEVGQEENDLTI